MNRQEQAVISDRCGNAHELVNRLHTERLISNEYTVLLESNQDIPRLLEEIERLAEDRDMWKNQADTLKVIATMS